MDRKIREVALRDVRITDSFWLERQALIARVTVPYMEKILRDEVSGAEKSHAIDNFRIAAGELEGAHYGMVFQDSDVAKWLETAAYTLLTHPDEALERRMESLIGTLTRAQRDDGYLNTYYILQEPENRWTNLLECHELYCAGHLIEAAVAHHEVTGRDSLLSVARRLADHIIDRFGEGKAEGIPGHQEIELALLRLYRATGDARYRDMALRFLDLRGQDPDFFTKHTPIHPGVHYGGYDIDPTDTDYNQTYAPVRDQSDARGHAVRMLYMLTAMADAADCCSDAGLRSACERIWDNLTQRRMYVTGGLGAQAYHESFSGDFDLPNGTAYNETCASVAMAFFAQRMLNLAPDGRYADVLELELYNGALAGMQLDGTRFFYVNPLEAVPGVSGVKPGYEHVLTQRPGWYACACCPPNLSRLIASLGRYLWSESDDTVYSHLFISSTAHTRHAEIQLESGYPWHGGAKYTVNPPTSRAFRLAIRIPAYIRDYALRINGKAAFAAVERGYLIIDRSWRTGDTIELDFDLVPRRLHADPRVLADTGCVALARGPLIYCLEGVDNPEPLAVLRLPPNHAVTASTYQPSMLSGIVTLSADAVRAGASGEPMRITAIPYYAWSNRGESEMRVWIREVE